MACFIHMLQISHGIETDEDAGASVETVQQFMKRYKLL